MSAPMPAHDAPSSRMQMNDPLSPETPKTGKLMRVSFVTCVRMDAQSQP